jgi:hypothetical protein
MLLATSVKASATTRYMESMDLVCEVSAMRCSDAQRGDLRETADVLCRQRAVTLLSGSHLDEPDR